MNLALLGFGVVGGGVYDLTRDRSDLTCKRILVRRDIPEIAALSTRDITEILNDTTIDTVVEVMGGLHPAYEYVSAALRAGKHVVTANKALIAAYYTELTALARENGVALRCTAAVGGGIPWLTSLERLRRLDTVCELGGIMNGTTNFIMDAMHTSPVSFPEILKKAQELGYAEADPSADIDGDDIRRKLTISANVAFDAKVEEDAIPMFGIRTVTDGDITTVKNHGLVCKLLASAQKNGDAIAAYIEPTLVDSHALEAAVPANFNLISYSGEKMGRQSYFGQGAGRYPTAGNVVQDCLDILAGKTAFYAEKAVPTAICNDGVTHAYYVRTAKPDSWLEGITAERWESGVITSAVSVGEMLSWAKQQLAVDPTCFVAGIR